MYQTYLSARVLKTDITNTSNHKMISCQDQKLQHQNSEKDTRLKDSDIGLKILERPFSLTHHINLFTKH